MRADAYCQCPTGSHSREVGIETPFDLWTNAAVGKGGWPKVLFQIPFCLRGGRSNPAVSTCRIFLQSLQFLTTFSNMDRAVFNRLFAISRQARDWTLRRLQKTAEARRKKNPRCAPRIFDLAVFFDLAVLLFPIEAECVFDFSVLARFCHYQLLVPRGGGGLFESDKFAVFAEADKHLELF